MSKQSGSQPFITDKQFQNLSLDEIRHLIEEEKEGLKKDYKELGERRKLIKQYKKLKEAREKVQKGIDIKKHKKSKPKGDHKKSKPKIKTFDDYFNECIKNKAIPSDTPSYFREALERAIKEYYKELVKEKPALDEFAVKYIIEGYPGILPFEFFNRIYKTLEVFFTNHRNIKFGMVLICKMEQQILGKEGVVGVNQDKAYF